MSFEQMRRDAVLRVGEVSGVDGIKIYISVDKEKNASDLFFGGDILKNVSVNGFLEIRKGFLSLIAKVEGEKLESSFGESGKYTSESNRNKRTLEVKLVGYINQLGKFVGGTKELPLVGNEAYVVTKDKIHLLHNLSTQSDLSINVATTDLDDVSVSFPIDGLFNSHIAIFGNTGSGKSNTLAILYQEFIRVLRTRNIDEFKKNSRFLLFDFNGEYVGAKCITLDKNVINLSTRVSGDKIPLDIDSLLNIEILATLADATEKTQKPFLSRTLALYRHIQGSENPKEHFRNLLRIEVKRVLQMSDKIRAFQLLDYLRDLLPAYEEDGVCLDIADDIEWHNQSEGFRIRGGNTFLSQYPDSIETLIVYKNVANVEFGEDIIDTLIQFLYLKLMQDVLSNRAQNEHIAPVINKLKSKKSDIEKVFDTSSGKSLWDTNFVVINLNDVNIEMRKTIPLLLAKRVYSEQKKRPDSSLTIIIDEAHNILSKESFREEETWKDYRLETFEEIVKEGRKFGVFVTISSQRPNDISPTITSQAHNYFIHRLINEKDLQTISSAVSYIDKLSRESIPALPTGTCIFSGVAGQMPLKINIRPLDDDGRPKSETLAFSKIIPVRQNEKLTDLLVELTSLQKKETPV